MSIIGLLDWDLTRWQQPTCFNLELMKISSYSKIVKKDIVQMELSYFSDMCTKVYIRKDYEDFIYPSEIINDPKSIWGGLALTNGVYSPLIEDIEKQSPDLSIYTKMKKYYTRTKESLHLYDIMMKAAHIRLTLNGESIFPGWEKQLKNIDKKNSYIIIHDNNIKYIKESKELINYLKTKYGYKNTKIGFKFPVELITQEDVLEWGKIEKIKELNSIQVPFIIENKILNDISLYKQSITYIIEDWTEKEIKDKLPEILLQGMFLSKYGIKLQIKLKTNININEKIKKIIVMLNNYFSACLMYRSKLVFCGFCYCKYCYEGIDTEEKIEIFKYMKEEIEDLFDLMYLTEYVTYENNKMIPHLYSQAEIDAGGGYGGFFYKQSLLINPYLEKENYSNSIKISNLFMEDKNDTTGY